MSPLLIHTMDISENLIQPVSVDPSRLTAPDTMTITKDFLEGDTSLHGKYLQNLDVKAIRKAIDYLSNHPDLTDQQKGYMLSRSWSVVYRRKPPTIEEFLTPAYLGRAAADGNIYPRVQNLILEFMNPNAEYRNLILAPFIGFGKSFAAVIITMYISVLISYMRDAKKYFNLNPATILCQALMSYSLKKSSELLLEPYFNILEVSDFFEKVHTKEGMIKRDREFEEMGENIDRIFWTTAVPTSALQFSNGANIKLISSVHNLLGLSIVTAVLTELSFFREAGKSDEYILRFYNDTKSRVESRMKGNYFGRTILDSSPDSFDNPIDKYIWTDAKRDSTNMIVTGARWEWEPEEFEGDERFPVYLGGPGKPPSIVEDINNYDTTDLLWVPAKLRTYFENDLAKAIKDIGGRPSGNMQKLLYDNSIIENMFEPRLNNSYLYLHVPSMLPPKQAIWDMIYQDFFRLVGNDMRFYYRPEIPRVFSIDQSENNDVTSISIAHSELLKDGSMLIVYDMTIVLHPEKADINLDSIRYFIEDLVRIGNMHFSQGSFDRYQSTPSRQYIIRELDIPIRHLSVDSTMEPYRNFVSDIKAGRVKVGKNIFIKNNLKSLRVAQRKTSKSFKIDHTLGEMPDVHGDNKWETSLIGLHAKDVTDSMAACAELLREAGAPQHLHNDFQELRFIDSIINDEDSYMDYMASRTAMKLTRTH